MWLGRLKDIPFVSSVMPLHGLFKALFVIFVMRSKIVSINIEMTALMLRWQRRN